MSSWKVEWVSGWSPDEKVSVDEARAAQILEAEDLEILVRLSEREGEEAVYWTCDFSHEYVTINGDYRT